VTWPMPRLGVCLSLVVAATLVLSGHAADDGKAADPKKLKAEGDRAFRNEKYQEAVSAFSQALRVAPDARTYYDRHKAYLKLRRLTDAAGDLDKAIATDSKFIMAYLQRGNLKLMNGECEAAYRDYEEVLRLDSEKKDAQKRLPEAKACWDAIHQGDFAMRAGRYDIAVDQYTEAMKPSRAVQSTRLLLQRARGQMHLGRLEEAVSDCAAVLKMDGSSIEAYELRGEAFYRMMDFKMAMTHFREGLKTDPDHAGCKTWYHRVKELLKVEGNADDALQQRDFSGAITHLRVLQQLDPNHMAFIKSVLSRMAKAHIGLKDYPAALQACGQAVNIDDNFLEGHMRCGEAHMGAENWDEAVRSYRRAHEIDQGNREAGEGLQRAEAALKQSKNKDFYKILDVPRNADEQQIKKAYRKKALEWHPDKHQDAEDKEKAERMFFDVGQAYEVLSDPEMRSKYDRGEDLNPQGGGQPQGQQFHGFPGNFHFKFNF